ncbi:hypothetical protein D1AOALGA4SA_1027 [Olavius algarvensis Delta 1 endosymbiont]|nr:hypothetical protein D1AOALGA4SA_1027 [Olavius algarvensis Delta 1 endosymbiont]
MLPPDKNGPTYADIRTHVRVADLEGMQRLAPDLSPKPALQDKKKIPPYLPAVLGR